jgi:hypothetical protein
MSRVLARAVALLRAPEDRRAHRGRGRVAHGVGRARGVKDLSTFPVCGSVRPPTSQGSGRSTGGRRAATPPPAA